MQVVALVAVEQMVVYGASRLIFYLVVVCMVMIST